MDTDKRIFYESTARRLAASCVMYGVDSVVHVEDKDDIWFWRQILSKYRSGRYKFMPATTNEKGNRNTGCTQCLKYRDFLCQRFFICIDSDLRYLLDEGISAENGILQTYTYSWENHCAFALKLQQTFEEYIPEGNKFSFVRFLEEYSKTIYEAFLLMLYIERKGLDGFKREDFSRCISLQYKRGDELYDGKQFIERLDLALKAEIESIKDAYDFDLSNESAFCSSKGLNIDNAYLYVRGHCLYNSLVSLGKKIYEGTGVDFEQNILKSVLAFDGYDAILRIKSDTGLLKSLRKNI